MRGDLVPAGRGGTERCGRLTGSLTPSSIPCGQPALQGSAASSAGALQQATHRIASHDAARPRSSNAHPTQQPATSARSLWRRSRFATGAKRTDNQWTGREAPPRGPSRAGAGAASKKQMPSKGVGRADVRSGEVGRGAGRRGRGQRKTRAVVEVDEGCWGGVESHTTGEDRSGGARYDGNDGG